MINLTEVSNLRCDRVDVVVAKKASSKKIDRKKRASWLEQKDKIQQILQQDSSRESLDFSSSESSEPPTVNSTNCNVAINCNSLDNWWDDLKDVLDKEQQPAQPNSPPPTNNSLGVSMSEEMKPVSDSTDWWASMKDNLDKETGTESTPEEKSEASSTSSSGDWWSSLTQSLDKETGHPGRSNRMSMEPDSPNRPVLERTRSRAQSMSAAMGRPEEDSSGLGTMLRIYNGIYRGETVVGADNNAVAHGVGTFTASNGEMYVGQWNQGKRHGKGLRTWREGKEYIGNWENNKRTGNVIDLRYAS